MPDFKLVEIRNITFDKFMDLATRCMFSITFGEGLDGYLTQPMQQGGIGFAIYNTDFFPNSNFLQCDNIFADEKEMIDGICDQMLRLSQDELLYTQVNRRFVEEHQKLYSHEEYVEQVKKLSLRQFEYFPQTPLESTFTQDLEAVDTHAPVEMASKR